MTMRMWHLILLFFVKHLFMGLLFDFRISSADQPLLAVDTCEEEICEYSFTVKQTMTMVWKEDLNEKIRPEWQQAFMWENGSVYYYDIDFLDPMGIPWVQTHVDEKDYEEHGIIVADGKFKHTWTVNDRIPGPTIDVRHGTEVVVHADVDVHGFATSLHWHGIFQKGTPWNDGAAGVNQCPLTNKQRYDYNWIADPPGTQWWHSHEGMQQSDGLAGFIIVRPEREVHEDLYDEDKFLVSVQDWYHEPVEDIFLKVDSGFWTDKGVGKEELWVHPLPPEERSAGGAILSGNPYESGLINGRGRFGDYNTLLSRFDVDTGKRYRFRFMNPSMTQAFRIQVDKHRMNVISFCGYDIEPRLVESFVISPAERYDIVIEMNADVDNYWLRARTLEKEPALQSEILAVVHYNGAQDPHKYPPTSEMTQCSKEEPCWIVNCPYPYDPHNPNSIKCISITELRMASPTQWELDNPGPKFATLSDGRKIELENRLESVPQEVDETIWLNFRDPRQVNRAQFTKTGGNLLFDGVPREFECSNPDYCADFGCVCTKVYEVEYGSNIEFVFYNKKSESVQTANALHPIHFHGHSFWVVAEGYGEWDPKQEKFGSSEDIYCHNIPCSQASWRTDDGPERNLVNPPRTDTVLLHPGHYVVVRIKANNPGMWHLHCHLELHGQAGMGVAINVKHSGDENDPLNYDIHKPDGYPTCGNFIPFTDEDSLIQPEIEPIEEPPQEGKGNAPPRGGGVGRGDPPQGDGGYGQDNPGTSREGSTVISDDIVTKNDATKVQDSDLTNSISSQVYEAIIVGTILAWTFLAGVLYICWRRRKNREYLPIRANSVYGSTEVAMHGMS